jgi:hypothetical protein
MAQQWASFINRWQFRIQQTQTLQRVLLMQAIADLLGKGGP